MLNLPKPIGLLSLPGRGWPCCEEAETPRCLPRRRHSRSDAAVKAWTRASSSPPLPPLLHRVPEPSWVQGPGVQIPLRTPARCTEVCQAQSVAPGGAHACAPARRTGPTCCTPGAARGHERRWSRGGGPGSRLRARVRSGVWVCTPECVRAQGWLGVSVGLSFCCVAALAQT